MTFVSAQLSTRFYKLLIIFYPLTQAQTQMLHVYIENTKRFNIQLLKTLLNVKTVTVTSVSSTAGQFGFRGKCTEEQCDHRGNA